MRHLESLLRRAVDDYGMIAAGDRVAVGLSGGKDSLTLLTVLAALRAYYPKPFALEAITLDLGFAQGSDYSAMQAYCEQLGVPLTLHRTDIASILFDIRKESNPCSLCAKMRRGAINELAVSHGCRKLALGHHLDDAVETFFLNLFYEGRLGCFSPVTYLDRVGITVIRPLIYTEEWEIAAFARRRQLPVVHNPCCADGATKRSDIKAQLAEMERDNKGLRARVLGAMQRASLSGWKPPGHERV